MRRRWVPRKHLPTVWMLIAVVSLVLRVDPVFVMGSIIMSHLTGEKR